MRNNQHTTKEIVELYAIKASYKHYLGSERSMFEVENTTLVKQNLKKVNISLQQLNKDLSAAKHAESMRHKPTTGNQQLTTSFRELEMRAIMLFNADKRFTITE
jgi:hypothetical protein